MTGAAAIALAAEIQSLAPLREVEWIAKRIDAVLDALRGADGVSESAVAELREAAARWRRMAPALREFYADVAPDDATAATVLWLLLTQVDRDAFQGGRLGHIYRLWEDRHGVRPGINLYPDLRRRSP